MKSEKINCLVVDDEPLAANLLRKHIKQFPQLRLIATCENSIEAFDLLRSESIDLLFLDIQMPGINGIKFARSLQQPPSIIFTTAYRDYAVESYELNVVDYLLKPITFERFFKSINKYFVRPESQRPESRRPESRRPENLGLPQAPAESVGDSDEQFMYVNTNRKHVRIPFNEVLYVESLKDYVRINLSEKQVLTKDKISEFEQKLPGYFLRVHRSYLVNAQKITAYTMHDIEIGEKKIPIGASYKMKVIALLQKNSTNK